MSSSPTYNWSLPAAFSAPSTVPKTEQTTPAAAMHTMNHRMETNPSPWKGPRP